MMSTILLKREGTNGDSTRSVQKLTVRKGTLIIDLLVLFYTRTPDDERPSFLCSLLPILR